MLQKGSDGGRKSKRIARYTDRAIHQDIKERARHMRKHPTAAENLLWDRLRRKQVANLRFRRQQPIGRYIVDFYCAEARLVIELDGASHAQPGQIEHDRERQLFLESLELRVLRFPNEQVLYSTEIVLIEITKAIMR